MEPMDVIRCIGGSVLIMLYVCGCEVGLSCVGGMLMWMTCCGLLTGRGPNFVFLLITNL